MRSDEGFLERDALISRKHGLAKTDQAIPAPDDRWHVSDLVPARLSLLERTAQPVERFEEKRLDIMRLEPPRFCALHLLADAVHPARVHGVVDQGPLLQEIAQSVPIQGIGDYLCQPCAYLGPLAIPHRLDHQVPQGLSLELDLPQDIEYLTSQGLARFLQLIEEGMVDLALTGLFGHHIPQVTDFRLPDPMNPAEPLLDPIRIPGEVIVHHQVRPLEVDALARCVGGYQDLHLGVMSETFLCLQPLLAAHAAVDTYEGFFPPKQGRDPLSEVIERVAMFGKDDQFLKVRRRGRRNGAATVWRPGLFNPIHNSRRREDLGEELREFPPFPVLAATPDPKGQPFEVL